MSARRCIETPHLPKERVGLILIGERYSEQLKNPLAALNINILRLPDNREVSPSLAGHADLSAVHLGGARIVVAKGSPIVNDLTNRGFSVIESAAALGAAYPRDCGLNVCVVGDKLICNPACADAAVLAGLSELNLIAVKQGYAKCSVCVVDSGSIITGDAGIAKAAASRGIDVLQISAGFISLPGFDSGLIGGCAFKISEHELAFTGTLNAHPDKDRIFAFLSSRGITPLFLTESPIFDIGSAIQLY